MYEIIRIWWKGKGTRTQISSNVIQTSRSPLSIFTKQRPEIPSSSNKCPAADLQSFMYPYTINPSPPWTGGWMFINRLWIPAPPSGADHGIAARHGQSQGCQQTAQLATWNPSSQTDCAGATRSTLGHFWHNFASTEQNQEGIYSDSSYPSPSLFWYMKSSLKVLNYQQKIVCTISIRERV